MYIALRFIMVMQVAQQQEQMYDRKNAGAYHNF